MRRDKYEDGAEEHSRGIPTTTKMAATDVERAVDYAIEALLNKLQSILSLKKEQTTSLKAFVS